MCGLLPWVEVGVALVTDPDWVFLAAVHRHPALGTRVTHQAAAPPAVMPPVELEPETEEQNMLRRTSHGETIDH